MKKTILAMALAAVAIPAGASAQPYPGQNAPQGDYRGDNYHRDGYRDDDGHRGDRNRQGQYDRRYYDGSGRYRTPRRMTRNDYVWRGDDGRYHCRRNNGTTGLIVGGVAGGLLGNVIDGGRNRTLGTLLGAGGGALLGRSVDRGDMRCR
jgi:hypothetical protein